MILKNSFEIYSNLFLLEIIIKEYNDITLKDSQETLKEFFNEICREKDKFSNIQQQLLFIHNNYEKYRNIFYGLKILTKDFPVFIYNQLIHQ